MKKCEDSHKHNKRICHKCGKNNTTEKFHKINVEKACIKKIKCCDGYIDNLKSNILTSNEGTITSLNSSNLVVTNINGSPYCPNNTNNLTNPITPIQYFGGNPIKPFNEGFNQDVFDDLWFANQLTGLFLNLDTASGRYRNSILSEFYNCLPCPSYDNLNVQKLKLEMLR